VIQELLETHNRRNDEVRQGFRVKLEEISEAITGELSDFKQMEQRVKI
jgi:hypothetical protein